MEDNYTLYHYEMNEIKVKMVAINDEFPTYTNVFSKHNKSTMEVNLVFLVVLLTVNLSWHDMASI